MLTESVLTAILGLAPGSYAPSEPEPICASLPSSPERIDAQPFAATAANGTQSWGATATYRLSRGETGEAFMLVGSDGSGEAQLMIGGEIIAHVALTMDAEGKPVITQWMSDAVNAPPEVIAEMMRVDLPRILADNIPQEFKCSRWGRKVMKAGKYMAAGLIGAAGAACCIASQGVACIACGAGVGVGIMAVDEFADGYCE